MTAKPRAVSASRNAGVAAAHLASAEGVRTSWAGSTGSSADADADSGPDANAGEADGTRGGTSTGSQYVHGGGGPSSAGCARRSPTAGTAGAAWAIGIGRRHPASVDAAPTATMRTNLAAAVPIAPLTARAHGSLRPLQQRNSVRIGEEKGGVPRRPRSAPRPRKSANDGPRSSDAPRSARSRGGCLGARAPLRRNPAPHARSVVRRPTGFANVRCGCRGDARPRYLLGQSLGLA